MNWLLPELIVETNAAATSPSLPVWSWPGLQPLGLIGYRRYRVLSLARAAT